MKDYLVKAYAFGGTVRIYAANTKALVNKAQEVHDLWPTATAALGRLLTASVIMGAMYKGEDELTVRVESDGPLEGMVATTNTKGEVRGYVGNPHVFLQYNNGKLNVGMAVGKGHIHVTKNLKVRDIFTSSVEIQTGEIAEDFAYYFTSSEQIPSAVSLGVKVDEDNKTLSAGGFILQVMPGCKEETIKKIEAKIKTLPSISCLMEDNFTPENIIEAITEGDHEFLETLDLHFACDCRREKFEKGLISLGAGQLTEIKNEDKKLETVCHFCKTTYTFDEDDLDALIDEAK